MKGTSQCVRMYYSNEMSRSRLIGHLRCMSFAKPSAPEDRMSESESRNITIICGSWVLISSWNEAAQQMSGVQDDQNQVFTEFCKFSQDALTQVPTSRILVLQQCSDVGHKGLHTLMESSCADNEERIALGIDSSLTPVQEDFPSICATIPNIRVWVL